MLGRSTVDGESNLCRGSGLSGRDLSILLKRRLVLCLLGPLLQVVCYGRSLERLIDQLVPRKVLET